MSSRFRTYRNTHNRLASRQGGGPAALRPCAETAAILARALMALIIIFSVLVAPATLRAAVPAGTIISNTASATYSDGSSPARISRNSNTVTVTTVVLRTPSTTELFSYAPLLPGAALINIAQGAYRPGSDPSLPLIAQPTPVPVGSTTPIDLSVPVPLAPATVYHVGEPIFVQVTDLDHNLDPSRTETVFITLTDTKTGDIEVILLTETGPDTGKFTGYIQSTGNTALSPYNGTLPVAVDSTINARYVDIVDGSDASVDAALVDPYGIVFDSSTSIPVNGVTVTLMNATTNTPATVYGDDGVTAFPATVTSGASLIVNGVNYTVPPGGYRFPFVNPGQYRLQIVPPAGYVAPSSVTDAILQALPGGPFALVTPGSRQEQFTINPGPALHIDIPVDPSGATLWLQKTAGKSIVAIGDFLPYQLDLANTHAIAVVPAIVITDTLPPGLRYKQGSTLLNGTAAPDPTISANGRTLAFSIGDLAARAHAVIRFVVEVSAGAPLGVIINQAAARSSNGVNSNLATAKVTVRSDFMQSQSIIMGEMIVGPCDAPLDKTGSDLSGIRLFLEDGAYVVTDKNGMFHFEGVKPGARVVQLDLSTVPRKYEILTCDENNRFAGRSYSQFVDMQGGVLWRTDFYLGLKKKLTGDVGLELLSRLNNEEPPKTGSDTVEYSLPVTVGAVPVRNMRMTVMLADGLVFVPESSSLDGKPLSDPPVADGSLTFRLGDLPENWKGTVSFLASVPRTGASGKLVTRALLTFNTPEKDNIRTPVADNALLRKSVEALQPGSASADLLPVAGKGSPGKPERIEPAELQQIKSVKSIAMPEIVVFPHFPTFGAELGDADRQMIENLSAQLQGLDVEEVTVTGHTDSVRIAPRSRHIYPDNFALSKARAESVGRFLTELLRIPADKFRYFGKGFTQPVASNRTAEGKARNRRVEARIRTTRPAETPPQASVPKTAESVLNRIVIDTQSPETGPAESSVPAPLVKSKVLNEKDRSGIQSVPTIGLRPGEQWLGPKTALELEEKQMPDYNAAWLKKAEPGLLWLWPKSGYYPSIANMNLAIKHDPHNRLKLLLNGEEVGPIAFDGMVKRDDSTLAVSFWNGVHLVDGDNIFEAIESDESGAELSRVKRIVHYSTSPVKADLVPAKSKLVADGKTPPVIAVRFTDKDGHPARERSVGEYTLDPPFTAIQQADESINSALGVSASNKLKYTIGMDGVALIELKPTTRTDEAALHFTFFNGTQDIKTRLTPDYRDWILVGIAEGTAGYNTISGNMESLQASGNNDSFYDKERLAFFAKGTIKGEWLLTAAFDSAKQRTGVTGNGLFQTIDPNSYYTLYGDGTSQGYEAASQRKLYLKIERDQFYAMFGDYDSGLSVTELSRYSRRMNGIKSEYRSKNLDVTVFGSETAQSFVKDEIPGDGTSGLYRLKRPGIVINSETISIETRDRFHSEVITSSVPMSRFTDYSIDYDTGAIFFKSPVANRDENLNPVYIVVAYEILNAGTDALTYGGRAVAKLLDAKLQIGGTYVHEGQVSGDNSLYGVDATAVLAPGTTAKAEFATTNNNSAVKTSGNAYLAEVTHTGKQLDGKVYFREQQGGFGLGQQNATETGTRKYGADLGYKVNEKVKLTTQGYRQYNLADGAVRNYIDTLATYNEKQYSARGGVRYANDTLADGTNATSVLGTAGGSWRTADQKITLRADHDQALFKNNNTDFPTRTVFGIDYQATKDTALFAQQELTYGEFSQTNTTRAGVKSTPWSGGSLNSSVVNDMRENGERTFANVGLTQKFKLTPSWTVDGGLERSQTIRRKTGYTLNAAVPPASGGDDFTAVSLGGNYTEKKLAWSNRAEYRASTTDDKWGLMSGLINEQAANWGWTARLQLLHSRSVDGNSSTNGELRFGLAYRPPLTKWIVFNRIDLIVNDVSSINSSTQGRRIVNNLNINYKPNKKTQLSILYGAKYIVETIDAKQYRGYTDLLGFEGRYDITKKWDVGLRAMLLHSWGTEQYSYSFGPSVGYNVMENAWISGGYNFSGFTDRDFSAANYTAQGPFIQYRFKFDQNSVRDGLKMMGQ